MGLIEQEDAIKQQEKLRVMKEDLGKKADQAGDFFAKMKAQAAEQQEKLRQEAAARGEKLHQTTEENESLKQAKEAAKAAGETISKYTGTVGGFAKDKIGSVVDATSSLFGHLSDKQGKKGHDQWKAQRDAVKAAQEAQAASEGKEGDNSSSPNKTEGAPEAAADETSEEGDAAKKKAGAKVQETETGLVPVKESAWSRFGSSVRDMPLLNSFYENPMFDRLGESEIAQATREIKDMVPGFRLMQFQDEVEEVIAPAIVKAYLEADADFLKLHCGEAAFAAVL